MRLTQGLAVLNGELNPYNFNDRVKLTHITTDEAESLREAYKAIKRQRRKNQPNLF